MNRTAAKNYAPAARRDFIQAVTARAHALGITEKDSLPAQISGDVAIIGGQAFPRAFALQRQKLVEDVARRGFEQVMEEAAYTWFNRFVALRFMELRGWLACGCMVLGSESSTGLPAILDHLADLDDTVFPAEVLARARELRLAGDREEELYHLLLIAQCNALHACLPLLFEKVSDTSELLLPDNLLYSDSVIRRLVREIPDEDWESVEIIGWLYQFYISEKKAAVIGKTVKTEDIPAATQLFTPNWIVQYMVQNTLGRQWLAATPDSSLREHMPYYIEPAAQEDGVREALAAATPTGLEPERLTLLDPACGSGHILVEAYNIFKRIYQERGYRSRRIPRLILENNLFGLDIDPRAAQLTQFVLLMLARKDDSRILEDPPAMNVMALHTSRLWQEQAAREALADCLLRDLPANGDARQLSLLDARPDTADAGDLRQALDALLRLFAQADAFGSLLRVPDSLRRGLPDLRRCLENARDTGSELGRAQAEALEPLLRQAELLSRTYDCVVANPPYMGGKGQNAALKTFLKDEFNDAKSDLFSAFILRNLELTREHGQLGFMSPFVWMFISSYEKLRHFIISEKCITSLVQLEYSGFDGATVPICTYTFENSKLPRYKGSYIRLSDFRGAENQGPKTLEAIKNPACGWFFTATAEDFKKIPGSPVAYWVSENIYNIFSSNLIFKNISKGSTGLQTSNSSIFIRLWHEISTKKLHYEWKLFAKGGGFRKWYGNVEHVVRWGKHGESIKQYIVNKYPYLNGNYALVVKNENTYFKKGVLSSRITSGKLSFRVKSNFEMYSDACTAVFPKDCLWAVSILNSKLIGIIKNINPTLNFQASDIERFPLTESSLSLNIHKDSNSCIQLEKVDWDAYEASWDFQSLPLLRPEYCSNSLPAAYTGVRAAWQAMTEEMQRLEEENNRVFIEAYGLQDELTPDVPLKEITLTCNPFYRYGVDAEQADAATRTALEDRLRADSVKELLSYAIGCMMGRYSLDAAGLVYAAAGNADFDAGKYTTFPADEDGIVPLGDMPWFDDDAAHRFREFCLAVWGEESLEENLRFVADQLDPKRGETPEATIRRWLSGKFFKDWHCKVYKKRPIYWLFSSGKHKAFECLVYLHRFSSNTLPRMRAAYVTPLQGKIAARLELLEREEAGAGSTSSRNALKKQRELLLKKQDELRHFDDLLRHYADQNIQLDLDDGVKVNYAKLADLLAESKTITGGKEE